MSTAAKEKLSPRPFLKWAGGKNRLILQYERFFPKQFDTYYEPFLGGGAVFFHLLQTRPPFKAVLTDINADLINTYCCVRDNVEELIKLLKQHQIKHYKNDLPKNTSYKHYYYYIRQKIYKTSIKRAARIIYLNRTCFNGLYRVNPKGHFNVPLGRYKNPKICNADLLYSVSEALQSVQIAEKKFETVLEYANTSDDFVYFDPPYYPLSPTSNFTSYSRYSFSKDDQIKLKDVFVELANRGVKVILSNSDCDFIRELYKGFEIWDISAARAINSNAKKRGKISEVLVTSC